MAYDAAKAHEYYINYRKKGLKKGRKKGTGKAKTTGLLGVSAAGLNSDGAVEAAVIKDRIKKEMNEKLKGAKTEAEKIAIRKEYAKKANDEIAKLRSDPRFARAKAAKASSSKGSSGSKSSGGSRGSSGRNAGSTSSARSTSAVTPTALTPQLKNTINQLSKQLKDAQEKIESLNEVDRANLREQMQGILTRLRNYLGIK